MIEQAVREMRDGLLTLRKGGVVTCIAVVVAVVPSVAAGEAAPAPSHAQTVVAAPASQAELLAQVKRLDGQGQRSLATDMLRSWLVSSPDDVRVLNELADRMRDDGRYGEAIDLSRRVIQIAPSSGEAWRNQCWTLIVAGRAAEGEAPCERAQELDRFSYQDAVNRAHVWLLTGQVDRARKAYADSLLLTNFDVEFKEGLIADFDLFAQRGWAGGVMAPLRASIEHQWNSEAMLKRREALMLAWKLTDQSNAAYRDADYATARVNHERTLRIREDILGGDHPQVATSLNNLAFLYTELGLFSQALPLYERCISVWEKALGPDHPTLASGLHNLAMRHLSQGRYGEAILLAERSLRIREKALGLHDPAVASAMSTLASSQEALGSLADALTLHERSLRIWERAYGTESEDVAVALNNLAMLHRALGAVGRARPLMERSLRITEAARGSEHPEFGRSLYNMALLLHNQGADDEAIPVAERSLRILEATIGRNHPDVAHVLALLAALHRSTGSEAEAAALELRSLRMREATLGPDHPIVAIGLHDVAVTAMHRGGYQSALDLLERSLRILDRNGLNSDLRATVQSTLSVVLARSGQPDAAIIWAKQAVNTVQSLRAQLTGLEKGLQTSFAEKNRSVYTHLADLLVQQGRLDEAQIVLQMLKEYELHESFERSSITDPRTTRIELTGLEQKAFAGYYALQSQQAKFSAERQALEAKAKSGPLSPAEQRRLDEIENKLLPDLSAGVERFIATLQEQMLAQRKRGERVNDLSDQQSRLRDAVRELATLDPQARAVALQFVATDERLSILLTSAGGPPIARQTSIKRSELNELILAVRKSMELPTQDRNAQATRQLLAGRLQKLYALLIEPVESDLKALGARTLMLSPNGELRYVPFAALMNGPRYLVQDYTLAMFTDAAPGRGFDATGQHEWKLAGLGLTQEVQGFRVKLPALRYVKDELQGLLKQPRVEGQAWLDGEFDLARFNTALRGSYNVLHVASHFEFVSGRPDASRLFLGDRNPLTLAEVSRRDMRFDHFDLVNFSACETGVGGGRDEYGQELESLGAKVLRQGAGAVMATLWRVADESTPKLMQAFYKARGEQGLSKAQALRQAQLAFINGDIRRTREQTWDHPYYWAPFILMGNWR